MFAAYLMNCSPKDVFVQHNVFLGHCSGFAKGVGNKMTDALGPLERLHFAINNKPEISCSTICSSDLWSSAEGSNFTGPLGIIIDPPSFDCITHTTSTDGGTIVSYVNHLKRDNTNGKNAPEDLCAAIIRRGRHDYNEICVRCYDVLGIFVDPPVHFTGSELFTIDDIEREFNNIPIFIRAKGLLYRLEIIKQKIRAPVGINELYNKSVVAEFPNPA